MWNRHFLRTARYIVPKNSPRRAEFVGGAVVFDDDVGLSAFLVDWPLGSLAAVEFGFGPAPGFGSGQAEFTRRVDHEDDVAHFSPAGF